MKTNNIISQMVEEYENLVEIITGDKEKGFGTSYSEYRAYDDFKDLIFQLYINHKKGEVSKTELEEAMKILNKYLGLFEGDVVYLLKSHNIALQYLLQKGEKMENKIKMIKKGIEDLKKEENRKQFAKELQEANNPEYGRLVIYFDFDNPGIYCESMTQGTIVPNSAYLADFSPSFNFEDMSTKKYNIFVDNLIDFLEDEFHPIFYDEKGEKMIL